MSTRNTGCRFSARILAGLLFLALLSAACSPDVVSTSESVKVASLGTAKKFAVLGGTTVTNTGPTVLTGNLGVSPGTAITGFPPGKLVGGRIHGGDPVASRAQADLTLAYDVLVAESCGVDLTGQDLGGSRSRRASIASHPRSG